MTVLIALCVWATSAGAEKNSNELAKDIGRQSRGGLELAIGREGDPVGLEIVGDGLAATGGALVPGGAPEARAAGGGPIRTRSGPSAGRPP